MNEPTKTWVMQRWSRWAMTPTGRQCLCYLSLKIAKMRAIYLRGRLQAAFHAGDKQIYHPRPADSPLPFTGLFDGDFGV